MPTITFCSEEPRLKLAPVRLTLPDTYRRKVDEHWAEVSAGGRFFNGPVLVASDLKIEPTSHVIDVSATDYAHYLYAMDDTQHEFDCRAVYSAAFIVTRDNCLLVGRMAGHTSSPGQIQCAGGGVEIAEDNTLDPGACCRREVAEELGAGFVEHQSLFRPLCIKTDGKLSTVGLIYLILLEEDAVKAHARFLSHQEAQLARGEKPEFDALLAVPLDPQSIERFLRCNDDALVDYLAPLLRDHFEELLTHVHA